MSLLDEIEAEAHHRPGKCRVAQILSELSAEDATDAERAMAGLYANAHITRVLNRRGHQVGPKAIALHRRGECICRSLTT